LARAIREVLVRNMPDSYVGERFGSIDAMREIKLPKYEKWGRYNEFPPGNIERMSAYWRNGWE